MWLPGRLAPAVAQQLAGGGAGGNAVLEGYLAVYDGPAVALRLLYPPPLVAGQVMDDLGSGGREVLEVVDHYVGSNALVKESPVLEPAHEGRQIAQLVVGFFQGHQLLVPHQPSQHDRRVASRSGELDVGPAVGQSRYNPQSTEEMSAVAG